MYVSIAFCFVFFMFCWKSESSSAEAGGKGERKCILTSEKKAGLADPMVIPPTPSDKMSEEFEMEERFAFRGGGGGDEEEDDYHDKETPSV